LLATADMLDVMQVSGGSIGERRGTVLVCALADLAPLEGE
jgi:hypothetical protein